MEPTFSYIPHDVNLASQSRDVQPRNHILPFDVLGLIFHHMPKLGPFDLHPVLFVCNSWYQAACHHSSLWSNIKLDRTLYTMFLVGGDIFQKSRASNYLRCCLKYSGIMPLDITLDFEQLAELSFGAAIHLETRLIPLLQVLVGQGDEHLVRWRSFTLHATRAESIPITLCFLPSTIPNLQTVKLFYLFHEDILHTAFPTCPNLQTVELHQYRQSILREMDCAHAAELKLGTDSIWCARDVEVLYEFRNVRRLTLYTVGDPCFTDSPNEVRTEVLFPSLHSLRLYGEPVREVAKVLKTPRLKEVEFDEVLSFNLFKDVSFVSTIQTAHVKIRRCNIALEASSSEKVRELLAVAPLLQRLCVPKWLYEELERDGLSLEERGVHLEVAVE
jgi:hypothetical protein